MAYVNPVTGLIQALFSVRSGYAPVFDQAYWDQQVTQTTYDKDTGFTKTQVARSDAQATLYQQAQDRYDASVLAYNRVNYQMRLIGGPSASEGDSTGAPVAASSIISNLGTLTTSQFKQSTVAVDGSMAAGDSVDYYKFTIATQLNGATTPVQLALPPSVDNSPNEVKVEVFDDSQSASATGTTTDGGLTITGMSQTSKLHVGQVVYGAGIPAGTTIASIDSNSQITLSNAATLNGTSVSLSFATKVGELDNNGFTSSTGTSTSLNLAAGTYSVKISRDASSTSSAAQNYELQITSYKGGVPVPTATSFARYARIKDATYLPTYLDSATLAAGSTFKKTATVTDKRAIFA